MVDAPHSRFQLPDRSYQAIVRSELKRIADTAGFSGHRLGELEIIIAEITSNLIKHASKGGEILAKPFSLPGKGMEIIAIDNGPGMSRPLKMMEDGVSSSKTLGQGLGAIRRLSDNFDLYSLPGWGTVLWSRVFVDRKQVPPKNVIDISVLNTAKQGEEVSGDAWNFNRTAKNLRIMLIDGLGHGVQANIAAREALSSFRHNNTLRPSEQLRTMHADLKKTRGGVVSVVQIDEVNNQVVYSGVGNISMKLLSGGRSKGCFSYNGIVGHIMPSTLEDHQIHWDKQTDILVIHSDGVSARWDVAKYPGILQHSGMILCGALYKDFNRNNDDSTILVVKFVK
jgi:anti-sigma regulatory factor (Ser/Thr protein kinase)